MCYGYDGERPLRESFERRGMSRRSLLRGVAGAGLGLAAVGLGGTPATAAGGSKPWRRVPQGLVSIQLWSMRDALWGSPGFDATLQAIADLGYPRVEQALGYFGRTAAELRAFYDGIGISATSSHDGISGSAAELEQKLKNVSVVGTSNIPDDMVFIGHTVKLLDLDDDSETLVRLVGEGLTLSAAVARTAVFEAFWSDDPGAALMHGPTYMANPLACAAANASLDLFETGAWKADVARIEAGLRAGLEPCRGVPGVVDVRVMGAIGVVEFAHAVPVGGLCGRFAEDGCWIRPMGKVVYLTPPLVMSDEDLAILTGAICRQVG